MLEPFATIIVAPADGHDSVCASLPDGDVAVASPGELRDWLRRIAAECPQPIVADVVRADGDRLCVGLGRPVSVVNYIPANNDPPYFEVVGEEAAGEVCFDYAREPTFYAARNTVSFETALEVACRFAGSSGLPLPDLVMWEKL